MASGANTQACRDLSSACWLWFESVRKIVDHEWVHCVSMLSCRVQLYAHTKTHWHPGHSPLVNSFHCLGVTMETTSSSPPNMQHHHRHSYNCPVLLRAVRKPCWGMTDGNGLLGVKEMKNLLNDPDRYVTAPVRPPPSLNLGWRMCFCNTYIQNHYRVWAEIPSGQQAWHAGPFFFF